jgi:hypothetical protein
VLGPINPNWVYARSSYNFHLLCLPHHPKIISRGRTPAKPCSPPHLPLNFGPGPAQFFFPRGNWEIPDSHPVAACSSPLPARPRFDERPTPPCDCNALAIAAAAPAAPVNAHTAKCHKHKHKHKHKLTNTNHSAHYFSLFFLLLPHTPYWGGFCKTFSTCSRPLRPPPFLGGFAPQHLHAVFYFYLPPPFVGGFCNSKLQRKRFFYVKKVSEFLAVARQYP